MFRPSLAGRLWYDTVFWSGFTYFTFGFSFRRRGWANVPADGPVLLVSNHQSMFDPVMVGVSCRRYLSYLARSTLFTNRAFGGIIRSLNAIPIDRGVGKEGIQAVLDALGRGAAVLMFPEGERTHGGEVQPLKPGVSLLVRRVQCPIVPVGIAGCFAAWSRHMKWPRHSPLWLPPGPSTMAISVGRPIEPGRYKGKDRDWVLEDLHREIQREYETAERMRRK